MKIEKYKVVVTTDYIHGWTKEIIEFWIPPVNGNHDGIVFNFYGNDNTMNCWFENKPRYIGDESKDEGKDKGTKLGDIELSESTADVICDFLKSREKINTLAEIESIKTKAFLSEATLKRNGFIQDIEMKK